MRARSTARRVGPPPERPVPRGAARRVLAAAATALLALAGPAAFAGQLATLEEALGRAFPGAETERRSAALTEQELARVEAAGGTRPDARLAIWHEARREGRVVGRAWMDTHLVRTLPETLLVSVDAEGRVLRVEVLAFREPRDYLPPVKWLAQFDGKPLDDELAVKRSIRALGGATLTGQAVTEAVRRCLALDAAVRARPAGSVP